MSRFPRRGTAFLGTGHSCLLPIYGPIGPQGPQGPPGIVDLGNTAVVDIIYGNDSTASVGGLPYSTVAAAVAAVSTGQTVWILPGTYTLSRGITLNNGTSLRGLSLQTTIIQMNVSSSTTMITMGENCRVEDLTINLTCTGSTNNVVLKGIVFGGNSSQTSKLRTSVVNIQNSTMSKTLTSTVYGVDFSGPGTGSLNPSAFSFNSLKGSTINVYSNGQGKKRGVIVSNSNQASTRDINVFVAQPPDTDSTGSYVGVETDDSIGPNIGSIQLRSTTAGTVLPTINQLYTASDILQTTPATISDPTYLLSPGIQIGPGTDLVTKSAGGKGFSTYVYPTTIYYGLKGNITSAPSGGYLWPGTQTISAGQYPDSSIPAAFFRIQQPSIISGFSASLNSSPGGTNGLTLAIYYTPALTISTTAATYTGYTSGTTLTVSSLVSGTISVGQSVSGPGIALNTYIVSGSGLSWTIYPSQTIGSSGTPISLTNGSQSCIFTGSTSGNTLTITSISTGAIAIGQYIAGSTILANTYITASTGNPLVWTINTSQNVSSATMYANGILPTPFILTFGPSETQKTFYNASTRLNTGDRIHLYNSYTSGSPTNAVHDITAQIDLF
jgi:hypothetical protein